MFGNVNWYLLITLQQNIEFTILKPSEINYKIFFYNFPSKITSFPIFLYIYFFLN